MAKFEGWNWSMIAFGLVLLFAALVMGSAVAVNLGLMPDSVVDAVAKYFPLVVFGTLAALLAVLGAGLIITGMTSHER